MHGSVLTKEADPAHLLAKQNGETLWLPRFLPLNSGKNVRVASLSYTTLLLLGLLRDEILQVLSGLERGDDLGGRLDALPGLRIHAGRGFALPGLELTESGNDDRFALCQRCIDDVNHAIECRSGVLLGEPCFLCELLDEFCLVHVYPLGL